MQSQEVQSIRPKQIAIAITLMYISLGLYIAVCLVKSHPWSKEFWLYITMVIGNSGLLLFLFYMIDRGINWARITLLVIVIISIPSYLTLPAWKLLANLITGILLLSSFTLQGFTLVIIFDRDSSKWFGMVNAPVPQSISVITMPKSVKTAVTLLYIFLGIYIYSDTAMILSFIFGLSPLTLGFQMKSHIGIVLSRHSWFILTVIIVRYVIDFYLIHMTWKGKNWARMIILLASFLGFISWLWRTMANSPFSLLSQRSIIAPVVLYVIALAYLFQKESNEWFKKTGRITA